MRTNKPVTIPFAIASGSPIEWIMGTLRLSADVGLGNHVAVRASFETFDTHMTGQQIVGPLLGAEVGDFSRFARVSDYGVSVVWYPRRLWDGFLLDVGASYRDCDCELRTDFSFQNQAERTIGTGHAMAGWSWMLGEHAFFAFAAGVSASRERDYEHVTTMPITITTSTRVGWGANLRFGVVLNR